MESFNGRRLVVWGTGFFGDIISRGLERETQTVDFFVDGNPAKHGSEFHGRTVAPPKTLAKRTDVFVIIAVEDDKAIADALSGMGKKEGMDYLRFSMQYVLERWESTQPKKFEWVDGEDVFEAPDYFYNVASPEEAASRLMADAFALSGLREREGLIAAMKDREKSGTTCPIFWHGVSSAPTALSFFADNRHPQVVSLANHAETAFERLVHSWHFTSFPGGSLENRRRLLSWCSDIIKRTFYRYEFTGDTASVLYNSDRALFTKAEGRAYRISATYLFLAQMLLMDGACLNHETLLKSICLAVRGAQAKAVGNPEKLVYVWESHHYTGRAEEDRRRWMAREFSDAKVLLVARLPEKTIDSHILHWLMDIDTPNEHEPEILRQTIALDGAITGIPPGMESSEHFRCIRSEDLYNGKLNMVLAAWCGWLGVEYSPDLLDNPHPMPQYKELGEDLTMQNIGQMEAQDLLPWCLSFADILKLRYLFQEEYRAWGYDEYISPSLDESIALYKRLDRIAALPIAAQGMFDLYEAADPSIDVACQKERHGRLLSFFHEERERRDKNGFTPIPLLYSL